MINNSHRSIPIWLIRKMKGDETHVHKMPQRVQVSVPNALQVLRSRSNGIRERPVDVHPRQTQVMRKELGIWKEKWKDFVKLALCFCVIIEIRFSSSRLRDEGARLSPLFYLSVRDHHRFTSLLVGQRSLGYFVSGLGT